MRIKAITGAGLLLLASLAASPTALAGVRIVVVVRPPPRIEYVTPMPYRGAVWIPGHRVVRGRWVWVPGCWVRRPYRNTYWIPARWTPRGRIWVWRGGYRGSRRGHDRDRDGWRH